MTSYAYFKQQLQECRLFIFLILSKDQFINLLRVSYIIKFNNYYQQKQNFTKTGQMNFLKQIFSQKNVEDQYQKNLKTYENIIKRDIQIMEQKIKDDQVVVIKWKQLFQRSWRMQKVQNAYNQPPFMYIGRVVYFQQNGWLSKEYWSMGSGLLISSRIVLTAAHNLFDKEQRNPGDQFYFIPETKPVTQKCSFIRVQRFLIHKEYLQKTNINQKRQYDLAILILEKDLEIEIKSLKFKLDYNFLGSEKQQLIISGYHKLRNQQLGLRRYVQFRQKNFAQKQHDKVLLKYNHFTYECVSGSPVFLNKTNNQNQHFVIGIHVVYYQKDDFGACILLGKSRQINASLIDIIQKVQLFQSYPITLIKQKNLKIQKLLSEYLSIKREHPGKIYDDFYIDKDKELLISKNYSRKSTAQTNFEKMLINVTVPIYSQPVLRNLHSRLYKMDQNKFILSRRFFNQMFQFIEQIPMNEDQEYQALQLALILAQANFKNYTDHFDNFDFCGYIAKQLKTLQRRVQNRRIKTQSTLRKQLTRKRSKHVIKDQNSINGKLIKLSQLFESFGINKKSQSSIINQSSENKTQKQTKSPSKNSPKQNRDHFHEWIQIFLQQGYQQNIDFAQRQKYRHYYQLNFLYNYQSFQAAWHLSKDKIKVQRSKQIIFQDSRYLMLMANIYKQNNIYQGSNDFYKLAQSKIIENTENKNNQFYLKLSNLRRKMISNYVYQNNIQGAMDSLQQSVAFFKSCTDFQTKEQYSNYLQLQLLLKAFKDQDQTETLQKICQLKTSDPNIKMCNQMLSLFFQGTKAQQIGDHKKAVLKLQQGLKIIEDRYSQLHYYLEQFFIKLADSYYKLKDYQNAYDNYKKTLEIYKRKQGLGKLYLQQIRFRMANCLFYLKKFDEAKQLYDIIISQENKLLQQQEFKQLSLNHAACVIQLNKNMPKN